MVPGIASSSGGGICIGALVRPMEKSKVAINRQWWRQGQQTTAVASTAGNKQQQAVAEAASPLGSSTGNREN